MAMILSRQQPELALLIACARPFSSGRQAGQLRTMLQQDINWSGLIHIAERHAMIPLLYHHLNGVDSAPIPPAVRHSLQARFRANVHRNMALTTKLLHLLALLEAHDIPVIPYKGPVLAIAAYGDLALRQFDDLDLLVPPRAVERVRALLARHGYRDRYDFTPAQMAAYLRTGCELPFDNVDLGVFLDVHWQVVRGYMSFPLDFEGLWLRRQAVQLLGRAVESLSPADLLLILCVHNGGSHHWERLSWVGDVAALLHRFPADDWPSLISRAQQLGAVRMLWLGLHLAHELLDAPVPDAVWQQVRADPMVEQLAQYVYNQLGQTSAGNSGGIHHHLTTLKMRERWRDRLQYTCGLTSALSIEDLEWVSLPQPLAWLYYGLRPVRLLAKHGSQGVADIAARIARPLMPS